MKRYCFALILALCTIAAGAQTVATKIAAAYASFEKDGQMKAATTSLYVIDAATGKVVFDKNGSVGLAPASTQKVITAATAYALLGKDFRYETKYGLQQVGSSAKLFIEPSGDPTLGSWRWKGTNTERVIGDLVRSAKGSGMKSLAGIEIVQDGWNGERIPDGWIWQDIGNYYGAGAGALNWRENQYDLLLRSGASINDPVTVVGTVPKLYQYAFSSQAKTAARGTGDNAYIYFAAAPSQIMVRGTIPAGESRFVISGAMPDPEQQFIATLTDSLKAAGIEVSASVPGSGGGKGQPIGKVQSPTLDSISYWFLRRSINLYGEALVKTLAAKGQGAVTTSAGISVVKNFWKDKGIDPAYLRMVDGSGLSPLNRVTTAAQVAVLQYAKKQSWYSGYFAGFPEYNGMKMKSGTISGAKGFCGYHKSADGTEYIFSFIVNNFDGSASAVVQKMYRVLDELK